MYFDVFIAHILMFKAALKFFICFGAVSLGDLLDDTDFIVIKIKFLTRPSLCVCVCVCVRKRECVCVCVFERERERERTHAHTHGERENSKGFRFFIENPSSHNG